MEEIRKKLSRKIYYNVEDKEIGLFKIKFDTFFYTGLAPDVRTKIWDTFDESNIAGHFGDIYFHLREYEYEHISNSILQS